MSSAFDPYYTWLAIPPSEQPPNLYRLLGLAPGESNPDVIANAADRQMAHLRTFQLGKHAAECQRLLNEVAQAQAVLLDQEKKAAYDASLPGRAPPVVEPVEPSVTPTPVRIAPSRTARRRKNPGVELAKIIAGAAAGLALALLLLWFVWGRDPLGIWASEEHHPPRGEIAGTQNGNPVDVAPTAGREAAAPPRGPAEQESRPPDEPAAPESAARHDEDATTLDNDPPDDPADESANDPMTDEPPSSPLDPPDETERGRMQAELENTIASSTPASLLAEADNRDDPAAHFVLLESAGRKAAAQGEAEIAFDALAQLQAAFAIDDALSRRRAAVRNLRESVAEDASQLQRLAAEAIAVADELAQTGQSREALSVAETALWAARRADDLDLQTRTTLAIVELQQEISAN